MTYDALLDDLKAILQEDLAAGGAYRNFRPSAIKMLLDPESARHLFPSPIDGFRERIENEVAARKFASGRYSASMYCGVGAADIAVSAAHAVIDPAHGEDIRLADMCDAIADHTYAQLQRLPYIKAPKPADEMERATAFVTGVYTVFAILVNGLPSGAFRSIYDRSWENYFTLYTARAVRETYDRGWQSKYSPSHIFYPLG